MLAARNTTRLTTQKLPPSDQKCRTVAETACIEIPAKRKKISRVPVLAGKAFVRKTIDNPATHAHEISTDSSFSRKPMACLPRSGGPIRGQCDLPCTDTNQLTMEWPFHTASWTQKPRRWAPDRVSVGHACDDISAHASGSQQLALGGK